MKDIILILAACILLTGCLEEGIEDCPEYLKLAFLHEYDAEEFDKVIGNDIYLQIFKDDILYSSGIIPFEEIKHGKPYAIIKDITGEIDIVSWAIPATETTISPIPSPGEGETRSGQLLKMKSASENGRYESLGLLFLGTYHYLEEDITKETYAEINLQNCVCQFTCRVHGFENMITRSDNYTPKIEIYGTKSQMDLDFQPQGEDATVITNFNYEDKDNTWLSPTQGLLPSVSEQFMTFKLLNNESHILTISTKEQSKPGSVIHLDIYPGTINLTINGWRIKDVNIEWI